MGGAVTCSSMLREVEVEGGRGWGVEAGESVRGWGDEVSASEEGGRGDAEGCDVTWAAESGDERSDTAGLIASSVLSAVDVVDMAAVE